MGYNALSGTVVMPGVFQVPEGSFLSGNLSTSDAANVKNVPRVSNAANNALITNVGGDANTLTCESNLLFDGSTLSITGDLSGSGVGSFGTLNVNNGVATIGLDGATTLGAITATTVSGTYGYFKNDVTSSAAGKFGTLNINNGTLTVDAAGAVSAGAITATTISGTYGYFSNDVTSSAAGKFATLNINNGAGTVSAAGALDIGAITATTVSGTYGYFKNDVTSSAAGKFGTLDINNGALTVNAAGAIDTGAITATTVSGTYGYFKNDVTSSAAGKFGTLNINNGAATISAAGALSIGAVTATTISGTYGYFKNDVTSSAAGKFATLDINNGAATISTAGALDIGTITATTVSGTYGYFKNDVTSSGAGKFVTLEINNGSAAIDSGGSLRLSSSAYLNWGNTTGASGYGLRDNNGTIQFKTSTGSWADLGTGTGGGGGSANGQGASGSIQYHTSGGTITGSARLRFINDDMVMTCSLFMTGALELDGALLPATGNTHNLGSAAKPWGTLYVSSSSIYFGTEKVSVENNNLRFGSGSTTKGFQVGFMRFRNKGITMAPDQLFELKAFQMSFAGGIAYKRRVVAWDYQILKTDYIVSVQTDTVTGSVTLTLPNADDCTNGQTFVIKDEGGVANTRPIQIDCSGSDVIDGKNQVILESPYAAIQVYCNGSDKYFIV